MTNGQTMHTLPGPSQFPTTRWTLVVAAGDPHRKEARSALVYLCENYWYSLYAYLRRRGDSADEAQDLTQEFFVRVLEGRYLCIPAMPITHSDLMAITIPSDADHRRSEATLGCSDRKSTRLNSSHLGISYAV